MISVKKFSVLTGKYLLIHSIYLFSLKCLIKNELATETPIMKQHFRRIKYCENQIDFDTLILFFGIKLRARNIFKLFMNNCGQEIFSTDRKSLH